MKKYAKIYIFFDLMVLSLVRASPQRTIDSCNRVDSGKQIRSTAIHSQDRWYS